MKFTIHINWRWVFKKARSLFHVGVFVALYLLVNELAAFGYIAWVAIDDLTDLHDEQEKLTEEMQEWRTTSTLRKRI